MIFSCNISQRANPAKGFVLHRNICGGLISLKVLVLVTGMDGSRCRLFVLWTYDATVANQTNCLQNTSPKITKTRNCSTPFEAVLGCILELGQL